MTPEIVGNPNVVTDLTAVGSKECGSSRLTVNRAVAAALDAARLVHASEREKAEVAAKTESDGMDTSHIFRSSDARGRRGEIFLVGAGLGRPDMLTIEATAVLARADVVLSDRLVDESLRSLFR